MREEAENTKQTRTAPEMKALGFSAEGGIPFYRISGCVFSGRHTGLSDKAGGMEQNAISSGVCRKAKHDAGR
jgi:hypothetical protein